MVTDAGSVGLRLDAARARGLAKQHLFPGCEAPTVQVVSEDLVGLHGTSPTSAYLSLRARIPGFVTADLDGELYDRRTLVRMKGMRGTVFLLPRGLAPVIFAATQRMTLSRDRRWLGIDADTYRRAAAPIVETLAGRALSVAEIGRTVKVDAPLSAVVALLCDEGRVVRDRPTGSRTSTAFRYRRWEDAFPEVDLHRWREHEAVRLLVQLYIDAYGPVTESDVVWWTGLPVRQVREAISGLGDDIVTTSISGLGEDLLVTALDLDVIRRRAGDRPEGIRLLPELDPFTMGYRDRSRFLDASLAELVVDRGGNATSVILVDGRVVGVWDLTEDPVPMVRVLLFERLRSRRSKILESAAEVGSLWYDSSVDVAEYTSMVPLTRRSRWVRRPLDEAQPAHPQPDRGSASARARRASSGAPHPRR